MLPADLGEVVDVGASGEGVPQLIQLAVKRCVPKALLQHGGPREANNRLRYIIMHFAVRGTGEKEYGWVRCSGPRTNVSIVPVRRCELV